MKIAPRITLRARNVFCNRGLWQFSLVRSRKIPQGLVRSGKGPYDSVSTRRFSYDSVRSGRPKSGLESSRMREVLTRKTDVPAPALTMNIRYRDSVSPEAAAALRSAGSVRDVG